MNKKSNYKKCSLKLKIVLKFRLPQLDNNEKSRLHTKNEMEYRKEFLEPG
jgi:hypothetical protein